MSTWIQLLQDVYERLDRKQQLTERRLVVAAASRLLEEAVL